MNPTVAFLTMVALAAAVASTAQGLPMFEENEAFVGGLDEVNTYRIPSVVCTSKGTVLVFCEARRDSSVDGSPTHLALKRSMGNAEAWRPPVTRGRSPDGRSKARNMTWLPVQILAETDGRSAYMNPVPIIDRTDGKIFLLVDVHGQYQEGRGGGVLLLESTDEGATWSKPRDLGEMVGRKTMGPGVGIQMAGGRLVAPTYDGVIYSDDHGKTWKSGGRSTPRSETQVVELVDGSLMLNVRGAPFRSVCISADGGDSWGEPYQDKTLTDSELFGGCQASLLRYTRRSDGHDRDRLLFSNPADLKGRMSMTVRMSYDEGKTWPVSKVIKKGAGAYSCLTVFPDGTIGTIYETGNTYDDGVVEYYAKLSFARFNLEWFSDGKDELKKTVAEKDKPAATQGATKPADDKAK